MSGTEVEYVDALRRIVSESTGQGNGPPGHILPHVYIGSQLHAENLRLLRKLNITHVLNCGATREHPMGNPYKGLNIDYHEFMADDCDDYDITQHFRESFNFLDKVKRKGGCCLVHCYLGVNRSAAVVIAYVMMNNTMTLLKAAKFVKAQRNVILSNAGFRRQLVRFARNKKLLDPKELEECERRLGIPKRSSSLDRMNGVVSGRIPFIPPPPGERKRASLPRAFMPSSSSTRWGGDTDKPFTRSFRISTDEPFSRSSRASERSSRSQPESHSHSFIRRAASAERHGREDKAFDSWSGRSELLGDGALMFKFNQFMNRNRNA